MNGPRMAARVLCVLMEAPAMQSVINWAELGIEVSSDRRQESRIALAVHVEVTGFDVDGKFFTEVTRTIDISKSGCGLPLKHRVGRGGILAIKILDKDGKQPAGQKPFLYQVARCNPGGIGWTVGVAKLQGESLWSVAFPEAEAVTAAVS